MNYFYNGEIDCKDQNDAELIKDLLTRYVFNHPEIVNVDDGLAIHISDELRGDITDEIDELCKELRKWKILIDGYIYYFGDGDGEINIKDSEWSECSGEEYIAMNMDTGTLIKELNRRGYSCYKNSTESEEFPEG